ncbi:MAG TPA: phytoene/squalene synthase family protein [Thermoleophilaceae bacterium]|nr:phytoene/squalene synthase family protein [Thermoleophilaceae bacterium]
MLLYRPDPDALGREARETTRRNARTFALACRLLPSDVQDDVYRLYLVFRVLDDLVDEHDPGAATAVAAVEDWCRDGSVTTRETAVLADLSRRHPIPREAMADFCLGMRDDIAQARHATEEDLDRYCYRVAGTVGLVMAALLGTSSPAAGRHAAALGKAMQRTNILRDIDEDLAAGRLFLAEETVARFGWPAPGRREELLRDQIARADALYEEGVAGIAMLRRGRPAISAAASMYREILRQIERDGYGNQPGRAVVPRSRKLLALARTAV